MIICLKILACLISVNVFGLLFSFTIMEFIIISSSIHIIIKITTIVMLLFFYIHNQYNYLNDYQKINYSFEGYLLAEHWKVFFISSLWLCPST